MLLLPLACVCQQDASVPNQTLWLHGGVLNLPLGGVEECGHWLAMSASWIVICCCWRTRSFRRFSVVPPSILSFLSYFNASSVFPRLCRCHNDTHDRFFLFYFKINTKPVVRVDCCIPLNLSWITEMIPFISREGKPLKELCWCVHRCVIYSFGSFLF